MLLGHFCLWNLITKLLSVNNSLSGIEGCLHNCTSPLLLRGCVGITALHQMHSHCRAHISGLQKQRLSWLLLIYCARHYQQASISAALGVPMPSYLLCETSKANLSAWELLIFDPLCASSALSFQMTSLSRKWLCRHCLYLFQNVFIHHLGCPCLQQYFWHTFEAWKGKGGKRTPVLQFPVL